MEVHTYDIAMVRAYSNVGSTAVVKRGRETERGKVVRLTRRLKRRGNDKDHHLLLVFLVSEPGSQQRPCIAMIQLQTSNWNVIQREDVKMKEPSKKERKNGADLNSQIFFPPPACLASSFTYQYTVI